VRGQGSFGDGWLDLDPATVETYLPLEEERLLFDLASIRSPEDAVEFIAKYGMLHHGPRSADRRERFTEWVELSQVLHMLLRLHELLIEARSGDAAAAATEIQELFGPLFEDFFAEPAPNASELLGQASVFLAKAISEGLEDVNESVEAAVTWGTATDDGPGGPGVFMLSARPQDLAGFAFHQLAMTVVQGKETRVCAECGEVFRVTDRRQRYCSSRCASRRRYRLWSERNRARKGQP
jgi:hypothetical protein